MSVKPSQTLLGRRGAFFCEHIIEWFIKPKGEWPPVSVWLGMALHLVMLTGLIMIIKWDRLGAIITIIGTVAFFWNIGYSGFPYIALVNILQILFLVPSWLSNRSAARSSERA